jgi:hypothetical protein
MSNFRELEFALGAWTTEAESAAVFDALIEASGLFSRVYREVVGHSLAPRLHRETKAHLRIDRVLIPGEKLTSRGWTHVIGVELKRSGKLDENNQLVRELIGPPLAQAIDYTYCVWNVGIYWMMCEYVFLWPFPRQYCVAESVMTQNRVGVTHEAYGDLIFHLDRQVIRAGRGAVQVSPPTGAGRKMGSR